MNKDNNKTLIITFLVMGIICILGGSTLAYWTWQTSEADKTSVTFTTTSGFSCSANGGGNITSSQKILAPTDCTNTTYAIKRTVRPTVTNNRGGNIYLDMWLNVNHMDEGLRNSDNFKYVLSTSSTSCDAGVVSSGTFKDIADGDKVNLLEGQEYTISKTDTYYLYIWLDKAETSAATMNQTFDMSLGGTCTDNPEQKPNKPVLDEGMIPVKIANDGTVTAVASSDKTWYDYGNQQWANAVLVKESGVRTRTANKVAGTTIDRSDILAYYVWIPRYSYQIWTTGVSATGQEQEINTMFESLSTPKSVATNVGDYYTHPAFTFGDQELSGIWVGKFETTGTDDNPTILDNVIALRSRIVSVMFATSQKFGTSTYGITSSSDAHMMKNSEWGAAAYLSRSKYGINDEIRINNSIKRGCGASTENASYSSTCDIAYGSGVNEYPQSTTGNISGIFDMSGGSYEIVMGNYNNTLGSSGFASMPDRKYYDLYTITDYLSCTLAACGGHALNETKGWYSDESTFLNSNFAWFQRGGLSMIDVRAGAFSLDNNSGINTSSSFRSVIVTG